MIDPAMVSIRLRYVVRDTDRHGKVRHYFRQSGRAKKVLPGAPGSDEFMAAYQAALDEVRPQEAARPARVEAGTLRALCIAYYASPTFRMLDISTRTWRRRSLDAACQRRDGKDGQSRAAHLQPHHIRKIRDEMALESKGRANNYVKAIRALFAWAVEAREAGRNPTVEVKQIRYASDGIHTWTEDEVAAFEAHWAIGTKQRLAMALMLYTTGRREDAVRLGPQHARGGRMRFTQAKNEHRKPVKIDIPIHPELARVIAGSAVGHLTYIVTEYGKPFSAAGFGMRFREWCDAAGLPQCSAHGLRKATATRLAERGASAHEIMSVTGHQTLEEAERYTRAARRAGLATTAMGRLGGTGSEQ